MPSLVVALGLTLAPAALPQEPKPAPARQEPTVLPASGEAVAQIARFQPAAGMKVSLVAAEPDLANPVAFDIDHHGVFHVVETYRIKHGVFDTRDHAYWLDDDLACRTVEDRLAMYRKHLKDLAPFQALPERVRQLRDRDGDGVAESNTVFAEYRDLACGVAAGVLSYRGTVYLANIPWLRALRDQDGDGAADQDLVLHEGFGVHVSLMGHDMHGLIVGPDRRLYFSIGDRGFHVRGGAGTLAFPDEGAVLRCELDGSRLEVFARGLRNPQELAFDALGNLFTGDNNSDGGDRARFVHLMEGSDSGWRIGYQWMGTRGPWNEERLWHTHHAGQPAHVLPPLFHLAAGPSGLAYYPGTGMPARFADTFFLCDFRGAAATSGVHAVRLRPHGAGFALESLGPAVWRTLATDCAFGVDGGLYFLDWVAGWQGTGKGRIYRLHAAEADADPGVAETRRLLRAGMGTRPVPELRALLAHPDQRVRQEAHFALADRGAEGVAALHATAGELDRRIARVHALWGLAIAARRDPAVLEPVPALLDDHDGEIRALAARVLGEGGAKAAAAKLRALCADAHPRVRAAAAMALGSLGDREATGAILEVLRANRDQDPWLRHAAVMGLARIGRHDALLDAGGDASPAVRLGALLALRRLGSAEVARFLSDPDPFLVAEAARAIHDEPIPAAEPALAALLERAGIEEHAVLRRALAASLRGGGAEDLRRLVAFAQRGSVPEPLRAEAWQVLGEWAAPAPRDRVLGGWRPIPARDAAAVIARLGAEVPEALRRAPDRVLEAALPALAKLGVREAAPVCAEFAAERGRAPAVRRAALEALAELKDPALAARAAAAAVDRNSEVRQAGVKLLGRLDPKAAIPGLVRALESSDLGEQQGAYATLGAIPGPEAERILDLHLDRLAAGTLPPEVHLDLLEAVATRAAPALLAKVERWRKSVATGDAALDPLRETLQGGSVQRGAKVFYEHEAAMCLRCHAIRGYGGTAGPDLDKVAERLTREEFLHALVHPSARIAEGYGTTTITGTDGSVASGVLKREDAESLELELADGTVQRIPRAKVRGRSDAVSAMPPMGLVLGKRDLRDLIEFLADLTDKDKRR
ncbi:MAG: HEAT repeat domain-containing protein [Planctomycetes bacterium]|nr:HEAT repeat domain-containing protein [Planctomycetota bacterium]